MNNSPEIVSASYARSTIEPLKLPRADSPATANASVARCLQAYSEAMQRAVHADADNYQVLRLAANAYREAMPPLCGQNNIRDFIACVSYAMLIKAIETTEGTKLLYAAQIAYGARENRPHRSRKVSLEIPAEDAPEAPKPPVNVALEPLESAQVS